MEALKNIVNNVPDWLKRLDDLSGQIEQRQIDLAKLIEAVRSTSPDGGNSAHCGGGAKSIRNKGSTESLKPRDEPEAHPREPVLAIETDNAAATAAAAAAGAAAAKASTEQQQQTPPSPAESQSPSALQRQTNQVRAAGQARARATLRKRQRTDSVLSNEGATPKYRTRSMIIVYYDSYVQMFFEELVKFVSSGRNMMRKAKMAAMVERIKRVAEMEMPDDDDDAEDGTDPSQASSGGDGKIEAGPTPKEGEQLENPTLRYTSTRRMMGGGPHAMMMSRTSRYARAGGARASYRGGGPSALGPDGKPQPPDVYDELDKGLEYVQSMCEHAAHQFLRDGECGEEVANIKRRLVETKEIADKEMERVKREEPEALLKNGAEEEMMKGRSYRPQSMRKESAKPAGVVAAAAVVAPPPIPAELEVDEGFEGEEEEELPKLVYKSTRAMR